MQGGGWQSRILNLLWLGLCSTVPIAAIAALFHFLGVDLSIDALFWFVLADIGFLAIASGISARASGSLNGGETGTPVLETFIIALGVLPILGQNLIGGLIWLKLQDREQAVSVLIDDRPNLLTLLLWAIGEKAGWGELTQGMLLLCIGGLLMASIVIALAAARALPAVVARDSAVRLMFLHCVAICLYSLCFFFVSVPFAAGTSAELLLALDISWLVSIMLSVVAGPLLFGVYLYAMRRDLSEALSRIAEWRGAQVGPGGLAILISLALLGFGTWAARDTIANLAEAMVRLLAVWSGLAPWVAVVAAPVLLLAMLAPLRRAFSATLAAKPAPPGTARPSSAARWNFGVPTLLRRAREVSGSLLGLIRRIPFHRLDLVAIMVVTAPIALSLTLWLVPGPTPKPVPTPVSVPTTRPQVQPVLSYPYYTFDLVPLECDGLAWKEGAVDRVEGYPSTCAIPEPVPREGITGVIVIGQSSREGQTVGEGARALIRARRIAQILSVPGGADAPPAHILNLGRMQGAGAPTEQRRIHVLIVRQEAGRRHSLPFAQQLERAIQTNPRIRGGTLCDYYDTASGSRTSELSCEPAN